MNLKHLDDLTLLILFLKKRIILGKNMSKKHDVKVCESLDY